MINTHFTAELHCKYGRIGVTQYPHAWAADLPAKYDGWLRPEHRGAHGFRPVEFKFQFVKQTDRHIYTITATGDWAYAGARLEKSKKGWLGLYSTHVAGRVIDWATFGPLFTAEWKIEPLQHWDGEPGSISEVSFHLRDADGHRVALINEGGYYMNAGETPGEILTFTLDNVRLR
ncbi:hypothetical protein [Pseudomonas sp. NPDC089406]|uniref:hypothetical protein n=1 Tax=Pseudomonas sp. NPDC089406 TaxID=3364463 RepID=UPI00384C757D